MGASRSTAVACACAVGLAGCGAAAAGSNGPQAGATTAPPASRGAAAKRPATRRATPPPRAPFAVGLRILTFVDRRRRVRIPGVGRVPRRLVTLVRYPATGSPGRVDAMNATPVRSAGPFPLVIFGHGFAVSPGIYARLLQAWTRAGYVVAAPIFPLENSDAPGGPDESDLINQPRDMSLVISDMITASAVPDGFFAGLLAAGEVAVTGQSDGGETALAVAYDRFYLDRRVSAAVILSGAKIPGVGGFDFPAPSPPLLATQGTADVVNPPSLTHGFFDLAPRPKFLLTLPGASHLGPYTDAQPQLGVVERVTIAFLDRYLKHAAGAAGRMTASGRVPGVALLRANP